MQKITRIFTLLAALATAQAMLAAPTKLEITADDTMRFNVTALEAAANEEVVLTFTNKGTLPKQAMGHNVVILKPGTDVAAFGNGAVTAAATDYVPADGALAAQIVAHTKLLGPGETDTITFTLPAPGTYPFICSFPGHWALMQGTIVVK